jgi:putative DNA primase/helicase
VTAPQPDETGLICACGTVSGPGKPFTDHYLVSHSKKHAGPDPAATSARLPVSDLHSARLLGNMHGEGGTPVLYGLQSETWHRWDGTVYAAQKKGFSTTIAEEYAMAYGRVLDEIRERYRIEEAGKDTPVAEMPAKAAEAMKEDGWGRHAIYLGKIMNDSGQAGLIRQLGRTLGMDESLLDAHPGQIVVGNGVLDIGQILRDRRVDLAPHSPESLVTRRAGQGVWYDPEAACPVFRAFLDTSVADPQQRWWLLWRTASALFGRMPRKGFVNPIGERDSGKTTYLEIMSRLGGSYAKTVAIKTFLAKPSSDSGFLEAGLRGSRFVYASEPTPGGRYDDGLMKKITGRDRQSTTGKWEKAIEWEPQCTAFIASNNPIRFATSDEAMMERQEVIRFARGYLEMDLSLTEKLNAELPGILNCLLETLIWEARNGVPALPASMAAEREDLATQTEDALAFVAEGIEDGWLAEAGEAAVYACVGVSWLHQHYRRWAVRVEKVKNPLGRKDFAAVVGRRYPRQRSNGWRFTGLVLTGAPVPDLGIQDRI